MRNVIVGTIAVAGGFLGGVLHGLITARPVTIRAERFEVIERSGRVLSYWGPDADRRLTAASKSTLLVFLDQSGARRFQLGTVSGGLPHLLLYDKDGPPDTPKRYDAQPRVSIELGWTGSPFIHLRGSHGDRASLGAIYGDVVGEPELGWALNFEAFKVPATASIGWTRWGGGYRSGISLTDGTGKSWEAAVGDEIKPTPLMRKPR